MAEERKGYRYKEEHPEYGKFHSNAEDAIFYDAEPLTNADRAKAAEMWDRLVISASPGKRISYPDIKFSKAEIVIDDENKEV